MIHKNELTNRLFALLIILFLVLPTWAAVVSAQNALAVDGGKSALATTPINPNDKTNSIQNIYLPVILTPKNLVPILNIPFFDGQIKPAETGIFWFGRVNPTENYADVRVGYNQDNLWVRVSVIDRRLWYDPQPTAADLINWDAVSLFLNLDESGSSFSYQHTYRFDAQMNGWEARDKYQAAYQASNQGWTLSPLTFTTSSRWWGFPQPNDDKDDRAWAVTYSIPFQSLGLNGAPPEGTQWRLGLQVHDRDDAAGTPIPDQVWPTVLNSDLPGTWGEMHFGMPAYTPPSVSATQTITIRNGLNGESVSDGVVGGNTACGGGLDFWNEWGDHSYPGVRDMNVQDQGNTDDWPCFSKVYITFPLDSLPAGKAIVSARLTLHQSGNTTGFESDPPEALNSLIQVSQIGQDWDEGTLSWNNAPQPLENVSWAWVGSITMADLGISRTWDVSLAADRAYAAGQSLRLVLYSADSYGPHGKYFFSSSSTDYNGAFRPSLEVVVGNSQQ